LAIPADDRASALSASREPSSGAGFQVIIGGRVWVITEDHITAVFEADGTWFRADPGTRQVAAIDLFNPYLNYAGDVALLIPT
jgi:hypothetical protein